METGGELRWPTGLIQLVLSAVGFADVSGCRVEASIAGVDEGTAGDQVSIVPVAHEVSQEFPGSILQPVLGTGVLQLLACGPTWCPMSGGGCSSAALQPGRLDEFEGRVGRGGGVTLCLVWGLMSCLLLQLLALQVGPCPNR